MILTQSDIAKESAKRLAESLIASLSAGLESMRASLELGRMQDSLEERDALSPKLRELAELLGQPLQSPPPPPLTLSRSAVPPAGSSTDSTPDETSNKMYDQPFQAAPSVLLPGDRGPGGPGYGESPPLESSRLTGADPAGLQAFRRAAARDLDLLEALFASLRSGAWRSGADQSRSRAVRRACLRAAGVLGLSAALLAGWWGWQRSIQERAQAELDRARTATAAEGAKLISMAAWLAMKTQGLPLSRLATDMSGVCSGIDVRQTLPNHPCREAWAANRSALFKAAIPAPGAPVDAPSEIFFDPWGGPYILLIPREGPPRVVSAGPDGRLGSADNVGADIPYWPYCPLGPVGGRERQ